VKIYYKDIKQYFQEQRCELLESNYVNAKHVMNYKCVCGSIAKICWSNFKSGRRCKKCRTTKITNKTRHSYQYVYDYFKNNDCFLLSAEYKNSSTLMNYQCACGNLAEICFANFKNGRRCKKCAINNISGSNHYLWNPDRVEVAQNLHFRKRCYGVLYLALKSLGISKTTRYVSVVGYTARSLKKHIIEHSNWQKVKDKNWEVDHIFPIKAFIDCGIKDIKLVNCLDNLQPILKSENRIKSKKYNKNDFLIWLTLKEVKL